MYHTSRYHAEDLGLFPCIYRQPLTIVFNHVNIRISDPPKLRRLLNIRNKAQHIERSLTMSQNVKLHVATIMYCKPRQISPVEHPLVTMHANPSHTTTNVA